MNEQKGQFLSLRTRQSIAVSVFYGTCSVALSMYLQFNKSILSAYNFRCFFILLFAQQALSLCFCSLAQHISGNPLRIPDVSRTIARSALPMAVLASLNVVIGLAGLRIVDVPIFFSLRRLVMPTVLAYEFIVLRKYPKPQVLECIGIMAVGTLLASWESLHIQYAGYAIALFNNVITAAFTVAQKQFSERTQFSAFGVLFYTSLIGAPISLLLSVVTGEMQELAHYPYRSDPGFLLSCLLCSCLGFFLTYSSTLSTTFNSPLATSVTGNLKDIFTTLIGGALFGGISKSVVMISGLLLSFFGAFAYSFISLPPADQTAVKNVITCSREGGHHNKLADSNARVPAVPMDNNDHNNEESA